jgi:predicted Zn-dependent peptidase
MSGRRGAPRTTGYHLRTIAATVALAAWLPALAISAPAHAQTHGPEGPPPPSEPRSFELPPVAARTLSNGARVLVVENREMPLVSVDLVLPGGQGEDPEGREGTALLVAAMLDGGTASRDHAEIVETLDGIGASLQASPGADWNEVSLVALTDRLDAALEIMAEVVVEPTFPDERLEVVRELTFSALEAQRSAPDALARRVLLRELFRGHPYGKQTTETTISSIDREGLIAHHARWYRPGSALFVVAGDIAADDAVARLERAFSGWARGTAPASARGVPRPIGGGVVLVHKPGSVQAEVRIGHLLPPADAEAWPALTLARHLLGSTPGGALHRRLREELGFTYAASATLDRWRDRGVLEIAFATRNEVAADAVAEALALLESARTRAADPLDFERALRFLSGVFPLRNETAQQVATKVAESRRIGQPADASVRELERLRVLPAGEVRRVFEATTPPDERVLVVVGDATVLAAQLAPFGPLRIETAEGTPLSAEALGPAKRSRALSATGLAPGEYRWDVSLQGTVFGSLTRTIEGGGAELTASSVLVLGPQTMAQSVTFGTEAFDFRSSTVELTQPGTRITGDVERVGGSIRGELDLGAGPEPVDLAVPDDILVSDMLEVAIWIADLEEGTEIRLPVANVSSGSVATATIRVTGREEVTVPAGTFEAFRIEITGPEAQTIWARVEGPHVPLRVRPADQPILLELTELPGPGGR